jgi:hypothetical protein
MNIDLIFMNMVNHIVILLQEKNVSTSIKEFWMVLFILFEKLLSLILYTL